MYAAAVCDHAVRTKTKVVLNLNTFPALLIGHE